MTKTELEGYVVALRVISSRNKTGIIRLVADLLKDHPKVDIDEVIKKIYPER